MAAIRLFEQPNTLQKGFALDCGRTLFSSLAIALLDKGIGSTKLTDVPLKLVLERLYANYPDLKPTEPDLTLTQRFLRLEDNSRSPAALSFTLQQMVVDEILREPCRYSSAFEGLTSNDTQDALHLTPDVVAQALAQTLGINVTLSFKDPSHELRKYLVIKPRGHTERMLGIGLQVQEEAFFAIIQHHHLATKLQERSLPETRQVITKRNIAEALTAIAENNKILLASYKSHKKQLELALSDGELSSDVLQNLFIKLQPDGSSNNRTLAKLIQHEEKKACECITENAHSKLTQLLIEALAEWIAVGLVSEEALFEEGELLSRVCSPTPRIG